MKRYASLVLMLLLCALRAACGAPETDLPQEHLDKFVWHYTRCVATTGDQVTVNTKEYSSYVCFCKP